MFTEAKGPCSQLVFDLSIKMPVANGWAEIGGTSRFLQARREGGKGRELRYLGERGGIDSERQGRSSKM